MDNTRELFRNIYDFQVKDRFCLYESGFWAETYERWWGEGLPRTIPAAPFWGIGANGTDVNQHLNVLRPLYLPVEPWPQPNRAATIDEDERAGVAVVKNEWGALTRISTRGASLPQCLAWPVASQEDWEAYKEGFAGPARERLPEGWPALAKRIRTQQNGIVMPHCIGLFAFPREVIGVEPLMMKFYTEPKLIERMLDDWLEFYFRVYEEPIRDTHPDAAFIWEDMSFKNGPLISPELCRHYLLPRYKRLVRFFNDLGIRRIIADSDGDVRLLIPIWREAGINGLMPFEVKAGNDVAELACQWPDLVFFGGIDKHEIAKGRAAIDAELKRRLPRLIGRGGYIAGLDHWVPPDIALEDYQYFRDRILNYPN